MAGSNNLDNVEYVSARSCTINSVSHEIADQFIAENHTQGALQSEKLSNIGLFRDEELLGIVQFGAPRTTGMRRLYTLELLRMCFLKGVRVRGGASKMIKGYIKKYNPADFFTYQDTTGETSSVYEQAGMRFVSEAKNKKYLVAPGKTISSGTRKEVLGMPYATRYGPDRILGTSIGEVYNKDGSRKSNKDIFLDVLGWHIETTTGDRVYEWINPQMTHYTYKITASDSDKYYYGVSHVKKDSASKEDCLADGYYGSGDAKSEQNKFNNWKKVHKDYLIKEIIEVFDRKADALEHEWEIISDLWKTDPLCLNSASGGHGHAHNNNRISKKHCDIHGLTAHQGMRCRKCVANEIVKEGYCQSHGETIFWGDSCAKCNAIKNVSLKECLIHGVTKHKGMICYKCEQQSIIEGKECLIHGITKFQGSSCIQCSTDKKISTKNCSIHGATPHQGNMCYKCSTESKVNDKNCSEHGLTKHIGNTCAKCAVKGKIQLGICNIHGEVKFRGNNCTRCSAQKTAHKRFHVNSPNPNCPYC